MITKQIWHKIFDLRDVKISLVNRWAISPYAEDKKEILSLTGLRFVAAFFIFVFHIHSRWSLTHNIYISNILGQGAIGMSVFFMLSGFVLTYRYSDKLITFKDYFINRFSRIYPIYFIVALLTLPWFGMAINHDSPWTIMHSVLKALALLVSDTLVVQAWIPHYFHFWNNGGSWSISVEFFCYIIFPWALALLIKKQTRFLAWIMLVSWFCAVLPGVLMKLAGKADMFIYIMPIFRLPEFLMGVCVCLFIRHNKVYRFAAFPQIVISGILLVYLALLGPAMPVYVGHNWLVLPVIAFMIFSLANGRGILAKILSSRTFVWLGKTSYCFYSFQSLIMLLLITHYSEIILWFPLLKNNHLLFLVTFSLLSALSGIGYYTIEEPMRRFIKTRVSTKNIKHTQLY